MTDNVPVSRDRWSGQARGRAGGGRCERRGGPAGRPGALGTAFPRTHNMLTLEFGDRADFDDPSREWRRLFSELLGTFALVLAAAGGGLLHAKGQISLAAAVVAPGLMVTAIILFMGAVSGAHLNPAVSLAFALRGDFPWRRVPGYIVIQLDRRDAGLPVPALGVRERRASGGHAAGPGVSQLAGPADGDRAHRAAGQRDLGHGVGGAERRRDRRARRRRLHRAGRAVGGAGQRRVDEPGPLLRPRPGQRLLDQLLGVPGGAGRRHADRRRLRVRAARPRRRRDLAGGGLRRAGRGGPGRQGQTVPGHRPRQGRPPGHRRHRCAAERASNPRQL